MRQQDRNNTMVWHRWNLTWFMVSFFCFLLAACGSGGGGGIREFDKVSVVKAIMNNITKNQVSFLGSSGKILEYPRKETETSPPQYRAFCKGSNEQLDSLAKLEEKGLVKTHEDRNNGCFFVSFLDKSAPYIQEKEKNMLVFLAKAERVEVTDLGEGKQTRTVKYKAYFTTTPFGEVILQAGKPVEEREALFTLSFDEGWMMN